jgi:hypothetical protein
VLGADAGNMQIWERQNGIVCSPWNWAGTMAAGTAGLMEGGVETQCLNMGRAMQIIWMARNLRNLGNRKRPKPCAEAG